MPFFSLVFLYTHKRYHLIYPDLLCIIRRFMLFVYRLFIYFMKFINNKLLLLNHKLFIYPPILYKCFIYSITGSPDQGAFVMFKGASKPAVAGRQPRGYSYRDIATGIQYMTLYSGISMFYNISLECNLEVLLCLKSF